MSAIDFHKITFTQGVSIAFILAGNLVAPSWFLFQFANSLFFKADTAKLILMSASIATPLTIVNYFLLFFSNNEDLNKKFSEYTFFHNLSSLARASLITAIVLYTPCLIKFFDPRTLRDAIYTSAVIQITAMVSTAFERIKYLNSNSKKRKQNPENPVE